MAYVVARGNALLVPSGTTNDPDKKHLFVVITDECNDGQHLLVSISSIKPGVFYDPTCVLQARSHPFVTVESYIEYRLAVTRSAAYIAKCVDNGTYLERAPVSTELLERISDGVLVSPFIPAKLKKYYLVNQP